MDSRCRYAISRCLGLAALALVTGCLGYRTPLEPGRSKADAGIGFRDGGNDDVRRADAASDGAADADLRADSRADVAADTRADLRADLPPDLPPDLRADVRPDAPADSRADALPDTRGDLRTDVAADVRPDGRPDIAGDGAPLANCPSGQHFVLLLGSDGRLYRFDSSTLALTQLATVSCGSRSLNSMTVSPIGPAYISSSSGDLCSVDLTTFKTTLTTFSPLVIGMKSYGMALLPDTSAAGQTLYISVGEGSNVNHLNRINLSTYAVTYVGDISPAVPWAELTAGPNGELYGFAVGPTESLLLNIDPKTASAIDVTHVPAGYSAAAFALVYWQDGFYLFLSDGINASTVYHYRKGDSQVATVGTVSASIIGAGVAACP